MCAGEREEACEGTGGEGAQKKKIFIVLQNERKRGGGVDKLPTVPAPKLVSWLEGVKLK